MRSKWIACAGRLTGFLAWVAGGIFMVASHAVFAVGADAASSSTGISSLASNVMGNLTSVVQLITAGSYVAGFAFAVAAIVKFKAHKDNPTQIMISQPIALLFVAAALIFIPSVIKSTGSTVFGVGSTANTASSGVASF